MEATDWVIENLPGIERQIVFSTNSLGLRSPEALLEHIDIRIFCLGGSTTICLYVTNEKTWPWRLQDELSRRTGLRVFVGNAGRTGHYASHHACLIRHYNRAKEFEWVVVLCSMNDMFLRVNYHDRVWAVPAEALPGMPDPDAGADDPVYYRRAVIHERLRRLKLRAEGAAVHAGYDQGRIWYRDRRAQRQAALQTQTYTDLPPDLYRYLDIYRHNLGRLIDAGRKNGQRLVFLTQPALYRDDLPDHLDKLIWQHMKTDAYTTGVLAETIDEFNKVLIEVCEREKIDCIDLAAMIPKDDSAMYDDCHFNVSGCKKVAGVRADFFENKLSGLRPENP